MRHQVSHAVDFDLRVPGPEARRERWDSAVLKRLDYDDRGAIVPLPRQPLHDGKQGADGRLAAVVVDPVHHPAHHRAAADRGGDDLRIEAAHEGDGVADTGPEQSGGRLAEQDRVGVVRRQVPAGGDLVERLRLGLNAVAEQRHQRVRGAAVEGGAQHSAGRLDSGIAPQRRHDLRCPGHRGLGVERQCPFGSQPYLIAASEDQIGEGLVDAPAQHDHVEQHRGGDGDARERQRGPQRLPSQAREPPGDPSHALPQSTIGRVCTRRQAAAAPAARPSASESTTLKSTMPGVISEKVSAVSKKRR